MVPYLLKTEDAHVFSSNLYVFLFTFSTRGLHGFCVQTKGSIPSPITLHDVFAYTEGRLPNKLYYLKMRENDSFIPHHWRLKRPLQKVALLYIKYGKWESF